jgi:hypothetical protein
VGGRRLTTWAMARPSKQYNTPATLLQENIYW